MSKLSPLESALHEATQVHLALACLPHADILKMTRFKSGRQSAASEIEVLHSPGYR